MRISRLFLSAALFLLVACGGGGEEAAGNVDSNNNQNNGSSTLESITLSPGTGTIRVDESRQYTANGSYSNGANQDLTNEVTWSTSDSSIASISDSGLVNALASGSVTVTAAQGDVSDSITLTVAGVDSLAISPNSPTVSAGNSRQLNAVAYYDDGSSKNISSETSWSSSNTSVATISSSGLLTGVAEGSAVITASYDDMSVTTTATVSEAGSGKLQISEVGSGNKDNGLWFEIYNPTSNAIDLGLFSLRGQTVSSGGVIGEATMALPGKSVPSGAYLVVMTKDVLAVNSYASFDGNPNVVVLGANEFAWVTNGFLELVSDGLTVDFVRFGNNTVAPGSAGHWGTGAAPAVPNNKYGQSIARNASNADADVASDWVVRTFASMGGPNDITCATDNDQDGIPDCSEQAGSTYAGMPLYDWGARPNQKDVFIEIDHMDPTSRPGEDVAGMLPHKEVLEKVRQAFADQGIHVHFDAGDAIDKNPGLDPLDFDLGGGDTVDFAEKVDFYNADVADILDYKAQNMSVARRSLFYYLLLAYARSDYQEGFTGSSGASEVLGNDIIVSIGHWGHTREADSTGIPTAEQNTNRLINNQAGTIMHEFGHSLGLSHGGNDNINDKPNYVSVMNYLYQIAGLPTIGNDEGDRYYADRHQGNVLCDLGLTNSPYGSHVAFQIGFSDGSSIDLDEGTGLTESQGFGRSGSAGVDYNCDGDTNDVLTDYDLNGDGVNVLKDYDDWGNIAYFFSDSFNRVANGDSGEAHALYTGRNWREPLMIIRETTANARLAHELMERQVMSLRQSARVGVE